MRIGIDAHMLGDRSGGNERFYENILLHMDVPDGWSIFLFLREGADAGRYGGRFQIRRLKSRGAADRYLRELPRLSRELRLDVLHTQYFIPFRRSCGTVCTIHDICFEHNASWFPKKEYLFQKTLIPYAARHADRVVTVSEYSRQDIVRTYGLDPGRVAVIPNAVDERFWEMGAADITSVRARFGIGDAPYILSVGNLNPRKNIARLIRAFCSMKERWGGREKLVIAGKEDYGAGALLPEAGKAGKAGRDIIFTGFVADEELLRLYRGAKCFVYPSLYEGFGIPPLEAMACGTPAAVSDRTSLPEVVGDAGLYFDPENEEEIAECLRRLLTDGDLARSLSEAGRRRARAFDWKRSAADLLEVYRGAGCVIR